MLIKADINELPKFNTPRYHLKLVSNITFNKKVNLYEAISNNHIAQLVIGITYNLSSFPAPVILYLPKGISSIEVLNMPTLRTLMNAYQKLYFLVGRNNSIIGIQVSQLKTDALDAYLSLADSGKIDASIYTVFRNAAVNTNTSQGQLSVLKLQDKSIEESDSPLRDLVDNTIYSFLASEFMRTKVGASIPLLGWNRNEIENNDYFRNLLKLFRNVYFLGYESNENDWQSIGLMVSEPYPQIFSLDDL